MKNPLDEHRIEKLLESREILAGEPGKRFYHRALSPKAKGKKKSNRNQARKSRKGNRK